MTKYQLYKFSLLAGIILISLGVFYKTQHHPGANEFLLTGMLISLIYFFIGLSELSKDENKSTIGKIIWFIGFIFFMPVAGIIYYFTDIKKHFSPKPPDD